MKIRNASTEVLAVKDGDKQRLIPTKWRSVFREIASALASGDYQLRDGIPGVEAVSAETALHIQSNVQGYGATLVELPEETWSTSVCIWAGSHWDALVDLWTKEEGQSDLVLSARVIDTGSGFAFSIHMVYVP